jgi:UDP-N-acetylmuramoylalanine--D-glutamate ligase
MKLILGLGQTGQAVQRYFNATDTPYVSCDTREGYPDLPDDLSDIDQAIISPGLDPTHPWVCRVQAAGIPVVSDIQLFAEQVQAPIVAITGTNGKSSVTKLTAELIQATGHTALIGGNYGIAACDLLLQPTADYYVLEVSSFQLEMTPRLNARVACLLNITPDHLERHGDLAHYQQAKVQIFNGAQCAVVSRALCHLVPKQITCICYEDNSIELPTLSPALQPAHQQRNVYAALSIIMALGLDVMRSLPTLAHYQGLAHRCANVAEINGVRWVDDSKATNIGATIAAIDSLAPQTSGRLIVLLGGAGKGQDFNLLQPIFRQHHCAAITFGQDGPLIAQALGQMVLVQAGSLQQAMPQARQLAQRSDTVLLAPACASFDEFAHFMQRGEQFCQWVKAL